MTVLDGQLAMSPDGGYSNPHVTMAMRSIDTDWIGWPVGQADVVGSIRGALAHGAPAQPGNAIDGQLASSYMDDYYYRVHVRPAVLALGNLVTSQVRNIEVWNAWPHTTITLNGVAKTDTDGMTITPPAALPLEFAPLQSREWQVSVSLDGPAAIDASVEWTFDTTTATLAISGQRVTAWTFTPNWSTGVTERLSWLTRVLQSPTGAEQRSSVRLSPRATFEFVPYAARLERSFLDLALFDAGSRIWALPIWHDIEWLSADVPAGATHIPVSSGVRDFHAGGIALLRGEDAFTYESVEIDSIDATGLTLVRPTRSAWPRGSRLYPTRLARLPSQPTAARKTDNLWSVPVQFQLAESYDFTAAAPSTTYRGVPVIEDRPVENDDLPTTWDRLTTDLDNDTGLPSVIDTATIGFTRPAHAWIVQGRSEHARLRGLAYYLAGRRQVAWRPTFAQDFTPRAGVGASDVTIDVGFVGYTRFAQRRASKRDIRIEHTKGAPLYRRIADSSEVDARTERLRLDSAFGIDLAVSDILRISYLELVRQNSDELEIQHDNAPSGDLGVTSMSTVFRALRDDLELPA